MGCSKQQLYGILVPNYNNLYAVGMTAGVFSSQSAFGKNNIFLPTFNTTGTKQCTIQEGTNGNGVQ
jgi:hypothetical protein